MLLAFTCEPWTVPQDASAHQNPGALSEMAFVHLVEQVESRFEPHCPASCGDQCWSDDCYTSDGTHIVVDYSAWTYSSDGAERWDVSIEPSQGELRVFRLTSSRTTSWTEEAWAWEASWQGHLDAEVPDDTEVRVTYDSYDHTADGYRTEWRDETWDGGACTWSSYAEHDDVPYQDRWEVHQSEQVLTVGYELATACWEVQREATLDGVPFIVRHADWSLIVDTDGDGASSTVDCDDTDATISPCATELPCDGIDQDCDGAEPDDPDDDHATCADDCDDADPAVHPNAWDIPDDGIDQDCDGEDARYSPNPQPEPSRGCGDGAGALLLLPLLRRRR